jgi:hypothetical protein
MCLFSLQVIKNTIWKALMPSIRSRPEGPKYGEKNLLWILWAASSSYELPALPPPPSPPVATPAKVSTTPMEKIICNIEFFCIIICIILFKKNF